MSCLVQNAKVKGQECLQAILKNLEANIYFSETIENGLFS